MAPTINFFTEFLSSIFNHYGVRRLPLQLFQSYLFNRKQCTVVNHAKSDWKNINCGVPPGSTLGPLLFLVYINDFPEASNLQVKLFADDAVFTCTYQLPN